MCMWVLSHVQLSATPQRVARQAPLSIGFSRQEYWSGLPFPPPGALPDPGIEPVSLASPALAGRFFTTALLGKPKLVVSVYYQFVCADSCFMLLHCKLSKNLIA